MRTRVLASFALLSGGVPSRAVATQHPALRTRREQAMHQMEQGMRGRRYHAHPPRTLDEDDLFAHHPPPMPLTQMERRLKDHLLKDYHFNDFPFYDHHQRLANETKETSASTSQLAFDLAAKTGEEEQYSRGVPVEVGMNIHKVLGADTVASTMDLMVWLRMRWTDARLVWDPEEWGGVDMLWFWADTGFRAGSEIWYPDLLMWNADESLASSLTNTFVVVRNTGSVLWSRPGHIKPACKFEGLDAFPFDALGCHIEIGSWMHNGNYLRPVLMDGLGVTIGGSETAGEAYAEYSIRTATGVEYVYPPFVSDSLGTGDWPVVMYHIVFSRAWEPYGRRYIALQITLNIVAFCCFWLPPRAGGREGLAITSMLAAVTAELVISAKLPSSSEVTWFTIFSMGSMFYSAFVVIQSTVVLYFYYYGGDTLQPTYVKWMRTKWKQHKQAKAERRRQRLLAAQAASAVRRKKNSLGDNLDDLLDESEHSSANGGDEELPVPNGDDQLSSGDLHRGVLDEYLDNPAVDVLGGVESTDKHLSEMRQRNKPVTNNRRTSSKRRSSFQNSRRTSEEKKMFRQKTMMTLHHSMNNGNGNNGGLPATTGISTVQLVSRDANDFKDEGERENNLYWQGVAARIDEVTRIVIPLSYFIFLGVIMSRASYHRVGDEGAVATGGEEVNSAAFLRNEWSNVMLIATSTATVMFCGGFH